MRPVTAFLWPTTKIHCNDINESGKKWVLTKMKTFKRKKKLKAKRNISGLVSVGGASQKICPILPLPCTNQHHSINVILYTSNLFQNMLWEIRQDSPSGRLILYPLLNQKIKVGLLCYRLKEWIPCRASDDVPHLQIRAKLGLERFSLSANFLLVFPNKCRKEFRATKNCYETSNTRSFPAPCLLSIAPLVD